MDKIYLFTVKDKKYATAQISQFDAESQFQFSYGDEIDYKIKEIELETIMEDKKIEWF